MPIKPDKDTNNNIVGEEEVVGGDNVDHNVGFGNQNPLTCVHLFYFYIYIYKYDRNLFHKVGYIQ